MHVIWDAFLNDIICSRNFKLNGSVFLKAENLQKVFKDKKVHTYLIQNMKKKCSYIKELQYKILNTPT